MAIKRTTAVMAISEPEPITRISWPKGLKLGGDPSLLQAGKKVCFRVEGAVAGFSLRDYGGDAELKRVTVTVEEPGGYEEPELVKQVRAMGGKRRS